MDEKTADFLISDAGWELITEINKKFPAFGEFAIINYLKKNVDLQPYQRIGLMELINQQHRAARKIFEPFKLLFERSTLEQASNLALGIFHRKIFEIFTSKPTSKNENTELLDGTAGVGLDTIAFSRNFDFPINIYCDKFLTDILAENAASSEKSAFPGFSKIIPFGRQFSVTSIEKDTAIAKLLAFNSKQLGLGNSVINQDVLEFLADFDGNFDAAYFDPARRDDSGRFEPDVAGYLPSVPEIALAMETQHPTATLGIKTAPAQAFNLEDLTRKYPLLEDFSFVSVSHKNELKECFFLKSPKVSGLKISAVVGWERNAKKLNVRNNSLEIFLQAVDPLATNIYSLPNLELKKGLFLHESAAALRTFGLIPYEFTENQIDLYKADLNQNLILSKKPIVSRVAHSYEVLSVAKPDKKAIQKKLQKLNCYAKNVRDFHHKKFKFELPRSKKTGKNPAQLFFIDTGENFLCAIVQSVRN